jgi:hypothetical protein|tara:strand:- start:10264 stop:11136 length:873 start_codon:yes stop_codon:yes gene_type:complete
MSTEASPSRTRDDGDAPDDSAVAPVAKKLRQGARHQPIEYIPGSVMRVKLHNFMTYTDVEMEPGPRLNVILGPNGTGKSSFVCALAIGLAGSTKLLGRADKLSEFVKRGEQSGYSEITLATSDPERPLVVRREIKRKDSSSTWRVNNVVVTLDRVKLEMHKLGVQLDNLCQFLPQDRVVEFARLTPESLLMETEKAIGNAELYDMHAELIRMKNDIAGLEREVRVLFLLSSLLESSDRVRCRVLERISIPHTPSGVRRRLKSAIGNGLTFNSFLKRVPTITFSRVSTECW